MAIFFYLKACSDSPLRPGRSLLRYIIHEVYKASIKTPDFVFELVTMENFPNSVSKRFFRETIVFFIEIRRGNQNEEKS